LRFQLSLGDAGASSSSEDEEDWQWDVVGGPSTRVIDLEWEWKASKEHFFKPKMMMMRGNE